MLRAKNIWVVGGDPRQAALAEASMAGIDRADCVILPLPAAWADGTLNAPLAAERHELKEVLNALRPGQLVCAGMAGSDLKRMAALRELVLRDYFAQEELAVMNAIPVALAVW